MSRFTKGKGRFEIFEAQQPDDPEAWAYVWVGENASATAELLYTYDDNGDVADNAKLVASVFTAATALDSAGYDALAVLESLPELMRALEGVRPFAVTAGPDLDRWNAVVDILSRMKVG